MNHEMYECNCSVLKSTFDFILRSKATIQISYLRLDNCIYKRESAYLFYTQFDYHKYLSSFYLSLSILSYDQENQSSF